MRKALFVKIKKFQMRFHLLILLLFISSFAKSQVLKIGIIADCQYCNCDFSERWNNDYRQGQQRLQKAVEKLNSSKVDMVFHLGDFIDRDFESYKKVKPIFDKLVMPSYFVLGNHEFSVADSLKEKVLETLDLKKAYYTVQKNDWFFVVLDGTDISPYRSSDPDKIEYANQQMTYYEKLGRSQAKPWNGAIGQGQLEWLETQLQEADKQKLNTIVLAHFPVLPLAALNLWNDVEIVQILENHKSVKAYFNGHHHPGNYKEQNGIHYITFQGMVRSQSKTAYAIVTLYDKNIEIKGEGREPNRSLKINK